MGNLNEIIHNIAKEVDLIDLDQCRFDLSNTAYFVESGQVDIFLQKHDENGLLGSLHHVFRIGSGQFIFPIDLSGITTTWKFVLKPGIDVHFYALSIEQFKKILKEYADLTIQIVDEWLQKILIMSDSKPVPKDAIEILLGSSQKIEKEQSLRNDQSPVWLRFLDKTELGINNAESLVSASPDRYYLVCQGEWIYSQDESRLESVATETLAKQGILLELITPYYIRFIKFFLDRMELEENKEGKEIYRREKKRTLYIKIALEKLTSFFRSAANVTVDMDISDDATFCACKRIGELLNIQFNLPAQLEQYESVENKVEAISYRSHVFYRKVSLESGWWKKDLGPILGVLEGGTQSVALIPTPTLNYVYYDSTTKQTQLVDEKNASQISPNAYIFYSAFPNKVLGFMDIVKFCLPALKKDVFVVVILAMSIGVFNVVVPLATGKLISDIIPSANRNELLQLMLALVATAFGAGAFHLAKNYRKLRISGKFSISAGSALWDRVLKLPVSFFNQFSSGDLVGRISGMDAIRDFVADNLFDNFLVIAFSVFNWGLIFYYSVKLAFISLALMAAVACIIFGLNYFQVKLERTVMALDGKIMGVLGGIIRGIAKIRIAGAESAMFLHWADLFTLHQRMTVKSSLIAIASSLFKSSFSLISSLVLFMTVGYFLKDETLGLGSFLAFFAAFGSISGAMLTFM